MNLLYWRCICVYSTKRCSFEIRNTWRRRGGDLCTWTNGSFVSRHSWTKLHRKSYQVIYLSKVMMLLLFTKMFNEIFYIQLCKMIVCFKPTVVQNLCWSLSSTAPFTKASLLLFKCTDFCTSFCCSAMLLW